jgi:hypothetical protein
VPADIDAGAEGGRFDRLDRLSISDPTAYEEAIEKMPREERDEYLRMG